MEFGPSSLLKVQYILPATLAVAIEFLKLSAESFFSFTASGHDATKAFENEKRYWNFTIHKCNYHWKKCGHYKQVCIKLKASVFMRNLSEIFK